MLKQNYVLRQKEDNNYFAGPIANRVVFSAPNSALKCHNSQPKFGIIQL